MSATNSFRLCGCSEVRHDCKVQIQPRQERETSHLGLRRLRPKEPAMNLQMAIIGVWLREVLAARIYAEAEAPIPSFDLDYVELSRWPDLCP